MISYSILLRRDMFTHPQGGSTFKILAAFDDNYPELVVVQTRLLAAFICPKTRSHQNCKP